MAPKNARNASTDDQHDAQSLQAAYQELVEGQKALQLEREALIAWQQQWQQHFQQREANVAQRETDVAHREAVVKERTYASETVRHNPYQLPKAICLNRKQAALQHEKRVLDAQREEQEQERRALAEQKAAVHKREVAVEVKERDQEHRSALVEVLAQHHDIEAKKKEASVVKHNNMLRKEFDQALNKAIRRVMRRTARLATATVRKAQAQVRVYQAREAVVRGAVNDFANDLDEEHYSHGSLTVLGAIRRANEMLLQVKEGFEEFPAFDHPGYSAAWDNHGFEEEDEEELEEEEGEE